MIMFPGPPQDVFSPRKATGLSHTLDPPPDHGQIQTPVLVTRGPHRAWVRGEGHSVRKFPESRVGFFFLSFLIRTGHPALTVVLM